MTGSDFSGLRQRAARGRGHPRGDTALWFVVGVVTILLLTELLAASAADSPSDELTAGEGSSA